MSNSLTSISYCIEHYPFLVDIFSEVNLKTLLFLKVLLKLVKRTFTHEDDSQRVNLHNGTANETSNDVTPVLKGLKHQHLCDHLFSLQELQKIRSKALRKM